MYSVTDLSTTELIYLMGSRRDRRQLADLLNEILVIISATAVLEMLYTHLNTAAMQTQYKINTRSAK